MLDVNCIADVGEEPNECRGSFGSLGRSLAYGIGSEVILRVTVNYIVECMHGILIYLISILIYLIVLI
jgi:hypothetical protein